MDNKRKEKDARRREKNFPYALSRVPWALIKGEEEDENIKN